METFPDKMQNKQESGKKTVTIVEVAAKAGVSVATASRALSGRGYASSAVKERVRTAARQLNYRLNASARSLKVNKTNNIGLVITDITNPFYSYLADGVLSYAKEKGYRIILCATNEDPKMERDYLHVLLEQRVDGIIAVPTSSQPSVWQEVIKMQIPLVLVDRAVPGITQAVTVLVNNVKGSYQATQYLTQLGHKRIGLISGPPTTTTGHDRTKGYLNALRDAGIEIDQQLVQGSSFIRENGFQAAQALLSLPELPTAIFATNNVLGEAAIFAIRKRGLRVPDDISFIMFDDVPWAALVQPAVTVVSQPTHSLGYMSLRMLEQRLQESQNHDERPPVQIVMEPEIIERESCLPLSADYHYQSSSPRRDEPVLNSSDSTYPQGGGKQNEP